MKKTGNRGEGRGREDGTRLPESGLRKPESGCEAACYFVR